MPTVKMFFQQAMGSWDVCFVQGSNTLVGVHWEYSDPAKIIEILQTANCRFRDIERAKQTIKDRRPGSIEIDLTQAQFNKLRSRKQSIQRKA
jgi:hypothetical protein